MQVQTAGSKTAPAPVVKPEGFTVPEFCAAYRISRGTFYNLLKDGRGPRLMKLGSRTIVSIEAARVWRERIEAETEQQAAA
jgi:predicted DNA-binding transcriptional regulator AlpA